MASHDKEHDLKETLVQACHILAMEGQGDNILGHVTARLPGWDRVWMKASGLGLEEVTVDDLVLLSLDGEKLAGARKPHEEYPIHTEIMRARPDVLAVVHTHPLHSVAFGAPRRPLRPIGHEGSYFWPPDVPLFDRKTDLIRTREEGAWVSEALGEARAVFLLNHGIAVPGASVETATIAALFLERAARMQLLAESDGSTPAHTSEAEARVKQQIFPPDRLAAAFDYYVRKTRRWSGVPGY